MGEPILEKKQLEEIGVYVKNHMGQWLKEQNIFPFPQQSTGLDREILERIVRVEEGLKHQGETLEIQVNKNPRSELRGIKKHYFLPFLNYFSMVAY